MRGQRRVIQDHACSQYVPKSKTRRCFMAVYNLQNDCEKKSNAVITNLNTVLKELAVGQD